MFDSMTILGEIVVIFHEKGWNQMWLSYVNAGYYIKDGFGKSESHNIHKYPQCILNYWDYDGLCWAEWRVTGSSYDAMNMVIHVGQVAVSTDLKSTAIIAGTSRLALSIIHLQWMVLPKLITWTTESTENSHRKSAGVINYLWNTHRYSGSSIICEIFIDILGHQLFVKYS